MNCPNCGAHIGDEDVFCGECGQPAARPQAGELEPSPEDVRDLETDLIPPLPPLPTTAAKPARPGRLRTARPAVIIGAVSGAIGLCGCLAGLALWIIGLRVADQGAGPEPPRVAPIYEDSFDSSSGWDTYDDEDTWAVYAGGGYRLGLKRADFVTWGNPEDFPQFEDFSVEVDAWQVEGPVDNNLGILVRYQDDGNSFYWFQISSDGYYSVDLLQAGEWTSLVSWEFSEAIRQGLDAVNRIQVECRGSQFDFGVNDAHLVTVTDASFGSGSIGLAAGTFSEPGVVVHFDNLKVTGLEE